MATQFSQLEVYGGNGSQGELVGWDSSRHPSVHMSVHSSTLSNIGPIAINVNLKHHWGGGKAVLDLGPDHIRTLVSRYGNR